MDDIPDIVSLKQSLMGVEVSEGTIVKTRTLDSDICLFRVDHINKTGNKVFIGGTSLDGDIGDELDESKFMYNKELLE